MDRQKQDELKQAAAKQAAGLVEDGMILGVGTGSTVKFFIDELGRRKEEEGLALKAVVTTSSRSRKQLEGLGFTVSELADIDQADLTVDGADRVDKQLNGIKGGGAALTLEKNVAVNSKKNVWIVDESKVVDHLSGFPLPVEVLPISCEQNKRRFEAEGLNPQFRLNADGSRLKTHYGNYILDLHVDSVPVPSGLADYLDHMVGVVEHGLFLDICDEVIIARDNGEIETRCS
ncbi:MAG: ribose-5-phosphate isomerase RpiA [Lactobacillus sp.]|jgi:ribose 5-phosphate isomerase A|nr:ribose-5-phosphate isomerase RpiA [Lactobacillus porci]